MTICGMDEVGRGALAGPLVAVATVLNTQCSVLKLKDSKKLSRKQREEIYQKLIDAGIEYRVEIISARVINNRGIGWANKTIFKILIKKLQADKYLIDGSIKFKNPYFAKASKGKLKCIIKSIVKADNSRKCVMAAAIIAKVTRDRYMRQLHEKHVVYGWDMNAGYGTKTHIEAIRQYGIVPHHRTKFVQTALSNNRSVY